jgi:hypothetical protein
LTRAKARGLAFALLKIGIQHKEFDIAINHRKIAFAPRRGHVLPVIVAIPVQFLFTITDHAQRRYAAKERSHAGEIFMGPFKALLF